MLEYKVLHRWDLTQDEGVDIQLWLRHRVVDTLPDNYICNNICLVDVSSNPNNNPDIIYAAAVVYSWSKLRLVEVKCSKYNAEFPYVSGLLAFRELPAILEAVSQLDTVPDMYIVDGHGCNHPRRFGIACHLGIITDTTTIGVAKSYLCGRKEGNKIYQDEEVYEWSSEAKKWTTTFDLKVPTKIVYPPEVGRKSNGYYISIGHKISLDKCDEVIRFIEKTNKSVLVAAHNEANKYRKTCGNTAL